MRAHEAQQGVLPPYCFCGSIVSNQIVLQIKYIISIILHYSTSKRGAECSKYHL